MGKKISGTTGGRQQAKVIQWVSRGGGNDGSQGVYYACLSGILLSFFSMDSLEDHAYKVFSFVRLQCKHFEYVCTAFDETDYLACMASNMGILSDL